MGMILVTASVAVFVWAVVGLIRPTWARLPSRAASVGVWVLSVVLFIIGGALMPDSTPEQTEQSAASAPASPTPPPPPRDSAPGAADGAPANNVTAAPSGSPASGNLTAAQRNAVRSANSYLQLSGFSRQGLIDQLSSEFGDSLRRLLSVTPVLKPLRASLSGHFRAASRSGALRFKGRGPSRLARILHSHSAARSVKPICRSWFARSRARAKLAGQPDPAGAATARVLGGYRRTAADRGRGQAAPLSADGLAAILATAERPRTDGRGVESHTTAQRRGRTDAVIAGLLFMGGLRRSEVSALEWRDVSDASDGDGVLITVRTSKTNQEGDTADVRYLKNGAAKAIRTVRADRPDAAPTDRVVGLGSLQIQRRFTAAAHAAGIEARLTAHSGRVGLASELTARGASTTEVMLAGNWRTSRMVAHYSAGAAAERGAVAKYL